MHLDSKNLIISIMFLIIIALMILVYKVNKLVVNHIPERVEPEVYVMGLTEAVQQQHQTSVELSYTAGWLKRHLDRCLRLIEKERGLEPIPIEYPDWSGPKHSGGYFFDSDGPFVIPYHYCPVNLFLN